jgi:hypothetical protein
MGVCGVHAGEWLARLMAPVMLHREPLQAASRIRRVTDSFGLRV